MKLYNTEHFQSYGVAQFMSLKGRGLGSLASDSSGELDVLWHDCYTLGMDSTQVGIFKQANKVSF